MRNRDDDDDDDQFEWINGKQILKDGGRVRVSLMDAQAARLHDGRGHMPGHRPGFAFSDASARDAIEKAYTAYETDAENAWKNPPTGARESEFVGAQVGDICTVRGPEFPNQFGSIGTMQMHSGRLVCVPEPDEEESSADDHALTTDEAYRLYDQDVGNMWRNPK